MIEINGNKLYHSTKIENVSSIIETGLKTGWDGCIYFADSIENSLKFLIIRGIPKEAIATIEIDIKDLDENLIDYSYDHNENFFGCKAYIYANFIPPEVIIKSKFYHTMIAEWEINNE